ncbi:hypothetical protein ENH_00040070, partial [Eimeria necatrix]
GAAGGEPRAPAAPRAGGGAPPGAPGGRCCGAGDARAAAAGGPCCWLILRREERWACGAPAGCCCALRGSCAEGKEGSSQRRRRSAYCPARGAEGLRRQGRKGLKEKPPGAPIKAFTGSAKIFRSGGAGVRVSRRGKRRGGTHKVEPAAPPQQQTRVGPTAKSPTENPPSKATIIVHHAAIPRLAPRAIAAAGTGATRIWGVCTPEIWQPTGGKTPTTSNLVPSSLHFAGKSSSSASHDAPCCAAPPPPWGDNFGATMHVWGANRDSQH